MTSVLESLCRFAKSVEFDTLDERVIAGTKQLLLDSLGCIVFGYDEEASRIARRTVKHFAAPGRSTLIGDGVRTVPMLASLANGVALRVTEYNDVFLGARTLIHPTEIIPPVLAIAEHVGSSGADTLAAISLGLELNARIANSVPIQDKGWHHTTAGILVTPAVAGKLLQLTAPQLANAVAISCSYGLTPREMHGGALSMMRSIAYPLTSYTGILAAFLAQDGFTGPPTALEGAAGLLSQLGADRSALDAAFDAPDFQIMLGDSIKRYGCSTIGQTAVAATIQLVTENNLSPDDIEHLHVSTFKMAWDIGAEPARRFPTTKESADHSMYYYVAAAAIDRDLGPRQFELSRINSGDIRHLIEKISIEWDPSLDSQWPRTRPTRVDVSTRDGRQLSLRLEIPPGDPQNMLSESEVAAKFQGLSERRLSRHRQRMIRETVSHLESIPNVGQLMTLLSFEGTVV